MTSSIRGFGMTFDLVTGGFRSWYVDGEGAKRWTDSDELVHGINGQQDAAAAKPSGEESRG